MVSTTPAVRPGETVDQGELAAALRAAGLAEIESATRRRAEYSSDASNYRVVPDGATVQTTLNLLAPLAARTDTFWIGNAGNPLTQYIVFDAKNSGYTPAPTNVPAFIAGLYPGAGYTQVFERSDVYVFRRR